MCVLLKIKRIITKKSLKHNLKIRKSLVTPEVVVFLRCYAGFIIRLIRFQKMVIQFQNGGILKWFF